MSSKLNVAKIVATPSEGAWSQAYHAGGFTAVISLERLSEDSTTNLQSAGKDILDTLISEYFTLTTKDLDTVRGAVEATVEKLPEDVALSMVVGAAIKNLLYIVIVNSGKALLKRGDKAGALLELESEKKQIESVSGYLEHDDLIILETRQFDSIWPQHELFASLDHMSAQEAAETLAPKAHESLHGGAAAIVFTYESEEASAVTAPAYSAAHETSKEAIREEKEEKEEEKREPTEEEKEEPKEVSQEEKPQQFWSEKEDLPKKKGSSLSHTQKLFLTVALVLLLVLIGSLFLFFSKQQETKTEQQFQTLYNPAKAKYDEGQSLLDLNKTLATEDFQMAKKMLDDWQTKLPKDTTQYKTTADLAKKIDDALTNAANVTTSNVNKASSTDSPLLSFAATVPGKYITQDTTYFYAADNTSVVRVNKSNNKQTTAVTNTNDWKSIGGLGTYFGNIYVLDKADGIDKYVSSGTSYGNKTAYFVGKGPDLSNAVSLAIDSSIWVLKSDGTVLKFTRGTQDTFALAGMDKPLSSPSVIYTTTDLNNLYIVDNGNSRLMVFDKTGKFIAQYTNKTLASATGLDVNEKTKKAFFLSGSSVYEVDLK